MKRDQELRQRRAPTPGAVTEALLEHQKLKRIHDDTLWDNFNFCLRVVILIILLGLGSLFYASPERFYRTVSFWKSKPILPNRNLLLLYPRSVKKHLPRAIKNYARYSEKAADAIDQLQQVQQRIRRLAMVSGDLKQDIQVHGWEVEGDFEQQLPTDSDKDRVCGDGFAAEYTKEGRKRVVLTACLLGIGTHDGFINYDVTLHDSITRGIRGLVVVSEGQYVSPDLVMLPILSSEEVHARQNGARGEPSTRFSQFWLRWILEEGAKIQDDEEYVLEMKRFLYTIVERENQAREKWVKVFQECDENEIKSLDRVYRRIATSCVRSVCCGIYDAARRPFLQAKRRKLDEDDDD